MKKVFVFNHPIINHNMSIIRRKETDTELFSSLVTKIAGLMTYEITKDLRAKEIDIETPLCSTKGVALDQETVIVPILRAGLGMVEGMQMFMPNVKVGHIGLYRDEETLQPKEYFCKLPSMIADAKVFVTDPMLATGGSAAKAISILKEKNVKDIVLVCLLGAPEGIEVIHAEHPDVPIYLAALDERLDEAGYILPGLGDAGDRIFGTK